MSAEIEADSAESFEFKPINFSMRYALVLLRWLWFTAWVGWEISRYFVFLGSPQAKLPFLNNFNYYFFSLNLWALIAACVFGFVLTNPLGWLNGKRIILAASLQHDARPPYQWRPV